MKIKQKREHQRFSVQNGKACVYAFDTMGWYRIKNMSTGGVCLSEGQSIPEETIVTIDVSGANVPAMTIKGKVVRSTFELGIQFFEESQ